MLNQSLSQKRKGFEVLMKALMLLSVGLTAALVLFLLIYVLVQGVPNITWELLSTSPSYLTERIGILPDILNTVYIVLATLLIVLPLGVGAAIYLTEYIQQKSGWHHRVCRRDPFRHPLYHLRSGGYAVVLQQHGNLLDGRCADAGHHESPHHHAYYTGEPKNSSPVLP